MPSSIECAKAGVTTGEWAHVLRRIFGDYRAPTGVTSAVQQETATPSDNTISVETLRQKVDEIVPKRRQTIAHAGGKTGAGWSFQWSGTNCSGGARCRI